MTRLFFGPLLAFCFAACATLKPAPTTRFNPAPTQAVLPREEAPHPQNSLEWWYLTGHLQDEASGETFGVEYVFFHFNLKDGRQDWQMVNVALTDPQGQRFNFDYRLRRLPRLLPDSLPLRLREAKDGQTWTFAGQEGRYRLQAQFRGQDRTRYGLDLTTTPTRPALLHGGGTGYEHYTPEVAAGYYSYPRLSTTGTLTVAGRPRRVRGELWYDRQWNCSAVVNKNVGWDWLSLQLDGDPAAAEDVMVYSLNNRQTGQAARGGTFSSPAVPNQRLTAADFQLEPLTYWTSPQSKKKYPATWRLQVPARGLDLTVEPLVPQQELRLRFFGLFTMYYWEGMCRVRGTRHGQPVTGKAYVEITNR